MCFTARNLRDFKSVSPGATEDSVLSRLPAEVFSRWLFSSLFSRPLSIDIRQRSGYVAGHNTREKPERDVMGRDRPDQLLKKRI
jgi:hypothetical protein